MHRTSAAVLVAVLAGVPACGGGGGDEQEVSSRSSSTTAADTATSEGGGTEGGGAEGGAVDAGDGETAGGNEGNGGSATTAPPTTAATSGTTPGNPGSGAGAGSNVQAAGPAEPGTYTYDTDGETTISGGINQTEPLPEVTTLTVDAADGVRQRSVRDMSDDEGDGSVTTTIVQYQADGVYLEYLKIKASSSGFVFTYEFRPSPARLTAPTGAGVGFHDEFSITSTDGGIEADVTIDILDEERLTIGGTAVDTLKVRTKTVFRGDLEGESVSTTNLSPEHSVTVREESVTDAEFGVGASSHTEQTSVLRSLDPS